MEMNDRDLTNRLQGVLDALGATPERAEATIRARGIKGKNGSDVIRKYLTGELPELGEFHEMVLSTSTRLVQFFHYTPTIGGPMTTGYTSANVPRALCDFLEGLHYSYRPDIIDDPRHLARYAPGGAR